MADSSDDGNNNSNNKDGDELTLHLTLAGNQAAPRIPVKISKSKTLPSELRKEVSDATKIPAASLRLIFRGRLIGDADDGKGPAAAEFKLDDGSVLHCIGKPATAAAADGASNSGAAGAAAAAGAAPSAAAGGSTVSVQQPPAGASAASSASAAPFAFRAQVPAAGSAGSPVAVALQTLRTSNSPSVYKTAVSTLDKILGNIIANPMEEKYRKVKKHNPAFQRRLGGLSGGDAAMRAAGFVTEKEDGSEEEVYSMHASPEAWPKLTAAKAAVEAAVREATQAAAAVGAPSAGGAAGAVPPFPAGMLPPFPGAAGGGEFPPGPPSAEMQNAMSGLLSDPNALQAMMQNPMVQNMIRNDPRMANNPMMQRAIEELATNPDAANRMSQMMSDPNMMRMMEAMRQQQQGQGSLFGGGGAGGILGQQPPGAAGSSSGANTTANAAQPSGGGGSGGTGNNNSGGGGQGRRDEEMTEEEMIAEAIRRSLQDS